MEIPGVTTGAFGVEHSRSVALADISGHGVAFAPKKRGNDRPGWKTGDGDLSVEGCFVARWKSPGDDRRLWVKRARSVALADISGHGLAFAPQERGILAQGFSPG